MKNMVMIFILAASLPFFTACQSSSSKSSTSPVKPVEEKISLNGIVKVPESAGAEYVKNFDRYISVTAPNGKPIHIFAQTKISDEQILRAKNILSHYLKDYPGSGYGDDKSKIADKMAENNAKLLLLNGRDDGSNPIELEGQPLFEEEIQVEGHKWYIEQDFENHRDAAFEEILHLVHDYGIGVDGANAQTGAMPEFQSKIREAQVNALNNSLWGMGADDWIKELTAENSLSQEYLAAVIDVYYGLWGAWKESSSNGMHGLYISKTRDEIPTEDPKGDKIAISFFHPYLTYNARIHGDFEGTFHLKFNKDIPYTNHSRYLKDITLTGTKNSGVKINSLDNFITGNSGTNFVEFSGSFNEYNMDNTGDEIIVTDSIDSRDGTNRFKNIEKFKFTDKEVDISELN
jgi:hypothetical protein